MLPQRGRARWRLGLPEPQAPPSGALRAAQEVQAIRDQAAAAHKANAPVARRAGACTRALGELQATLPQPLTTPDVCALLAPILNLMGRFTENAEERLVRLQDQLTCAFVQEACQVPPPHTCAARSACAAPGRDLLLHLHGDGAKRVGSPLREPVWACRDCSRGSARALAFCWPWSASRGTRRTTPCWLRCCWPHTPQQAPAKRLECRPGSPSWPRRCTCRCARTAWSRTPHPGSRWAQCGRMSCMTQHGQYAAAWQAGCCRKAAGRAEHRGMRLSALRAAGQPGHAQLPQYGPRPWLG